MTLSKYKIKSTATLLLFSFLLISCGKYVFNEQDRSIQNDINVSAIINGNIVSADNILSKSVVAIMNNSNFFVFQESVPAWQTICTGTVLNKNMILTAAHCLHDFVGNERNVKALAVNFSLNKLDKDGIKTSKLDKLTSRKVKKIYANREWKKTEDRQNDIGIILLEDEIPRVAMPVKILPPHLIQNKNNGQHVFTLFGFGYTSQKIEGLSGMFSNKVTISPNELRTIKTNGRFDLDLITMSPGACHGDSGGPAFIKVNDVDYQAGITSGASQKSKSCYDDAVFVDVSTHKDFLEEAIDALTRDI